jgi:hypothetical protein
LYQSIIGISLDENIYPNSMQHPTTHSLHDKFSTEEEDDNDNNDEPLVI